MKQRSRLIVVEDPPSVTTPRQHSPRIARLGLRVLGGLCAGAVMLLLPQHPASAQGRLDARYEATLAGIPVGKGAWTIDIQDDQFSAAASGGTSGLDRKSTRLNSSHLRESRMPSSA